MSLNEQIAMNISIERAKVMLFLLKQGGIF